MLSEFYIKNYFIKANICPIILKSFNKVLSPLACQSIISFFSILSRIISWETTKIIQEILYGVEIWRSQWVGITFIVNIQLQMLIVEGKARTDTSNIFHTVKPIPYLCFITYNNSKRSNLLIWNSYISFANPPLQIIINKMICHLTGRNNRGRDFV